MQNRSQESKEKPSTRWSYHPHSTTPTFPPQITRQRATCDCKDNTQTNRKISSVCGKMRMLLYDIFMVTMGDNYITRQLEKGKLHTKFPIQHKHSNGVPPKYAFATLLLQAAIHSNAAQLQLGLHPIHDLQLTHGRMSYHSSHIHNRLIQITEDYELPTRTTALLFNFGQNYRHITQAIVEELKRVRSLPWPIKLEDLG